MGRPIVYLADTSALALLETLVRTNKTRIPSAYQLIEVQTPDDLAVAEWPIGQEVLDKELTRDWGDAFLDGMGSLLARVPSRVAPHASNFLLNPRHADFAGVRIVGSRRWLWDVRLFGHAPAR